VEKPQGDGMWINGGFFVLEPEIFNYLQGDVENIQWENQPLLEIANNKQLAAYKHQGFWKPMDALRDRIELEQMWQNNTAKWKIWG
jgi:glucose-1-phosphate cytidylyltransferase